ncbi:hypothetical protein AA106555_1289 [Neokomagataea thailandica NBRC 106555]|uniref:Transposase n=1 Tax=Neokomagataea thailandica NBRC 106555 TaxID=1223520 RepID=A0ABQ0QQJ6_9PROT|nr:hypothetical protein AA106555_1289 [Neokomagataea thailandica NBRC 106555]
MQRPAPRGAGDKRVEKHTRYDNRRESAPHGWPAMDDCEGGCHEAGADKESAGREDGHHVLVGTEQGCKKKRWFQNAYAIA